MSSSDAESPAGSSNTSSEAPPSSLTILVVSEGTDLAGLSTAAALAAAGVDVHVYEQHEAAVPCVDPGFAFTPELAAFCRELGLQKVGVATASSRQVLADDGELAVAAPTEADYTSWEALRSALLSKLPAGHYHPGSTVVSVDLSDPSSAVIELESGERIAGHLIVAADGINSALRRQLLPNCEPTYAGYLAWRGVARADKLSGAVQHLLADKFSMFKGAYLHVHVHPLPDADGSKPSSSGRNGGAVGSSMATRGSAKDLKALFGGGDSEHSRVAWTWFNNQVEEELPGLLLDRDLVYQQQYVPLGQLNPAVAEAVAQAAADALPPPIAELIAQSSASMGVSAVSDMVLSGCVIANKLALVGQAGAVIRPHSSSPAQQAVHDALTLVNALKLHKFVPERALPRWEQQQVQHYLAQCHAAVAAGERMQGFTNC